jgi:hypothetical protein
MTAGEGRKVMPIVEKRTWVTTAVAALLFLALVAPAAAQTCDPQANAVTVNVFVADESEADPAAEPIVYALPGHPNFLFQPGWGLHTFHLSQGTWTFKAEAGNYLSTPEYGTTVCTRDPDTGCVACTGQSYSLPMWARLGNIVGNVTRLPTREGVDNVQIQSTQDGPNSAYTFSYPSGEYNFARLGNAYKRFENDWAVVVHGDGSGRGSKLYNLVLIGYDAPPQEVTVFSSQAAVADFVIWDPTQVLPDQRCSCGDESAAPQSLSTPKANGPGGQSCLGEPVSATSGNAYFDHVDAVLGGVGPEVRFLRSYNSFARNRWGAFGPGWSHSYEQQITLPSARLLVLWRGSGVPLYYEDNDGDLVYQPSVPFNRDNWVRKQADGTFVRHFRAGGQENFNAGGRLASVADASGNAVSLTYDASN